MILVDYSSTAVANIITQLKNMDDGVNENLIRHMIVNSLLSYSKKFKREYGEMVLCLDGGNVWRKDTFPYYKAKRKESREKSDIDWSLLHSIMDKVATEIRLNMPYRMVGVNGAEADDCIAVLALTVPASEKVMIISNDKDFQQLQVRSNVKQFSPLKGKLYTCPKPEYYLKEQIIRGDVSDGIPNIFSDSDTFVVPGKRQKPIRQTKLDEWIHQNFEDFATDMSNVERNKTLIDLTMTPDHIRSEILEQYREYVINSRQLMYKYFVASRLTNLMSEMQNF